MRKVLADEHGQHIMALAKDLAGSGGMPARRAARRAMPGLWHFGYLFAQALTIGGGTGDVQRNIVAERVLGLQPRHRRRSSGLSLVARHAGADPRVLRRRPRRVRCRAWPKPETTQRSSHTRRSSPHSRPARRAGWDPGQGDAANRLQLDPLPGPLRQRGRDPVARRPTSWSAPRTTRRRWVPPPERQRRLGVGAQRSLRSTQLSGQPDRPQGEPSEAQHADRLRGRFRRVRRQGQGARVGRDGHRLCGRGVRLRRPHVDGLPGGGDRDDPDRVGHPAGLHPDADADRHDRGRGGRPLRGTRHPRAGRIRTAGDRGLPRGALQGAGRAHPRGDRHLPQGLGPRGARSCTTAGTTSSRCPADQGTGLGKPLKIITHPRARRRSRSTWRHWDPRTSR